MYDHSFQSGFAQNDSPQSLTNQKPTLSKLLFWTVRKTEDRYWELATPYGRTFHMPFRNLQKRTLEKLCFIAQPNRVESSLRKLRFFPIKILWMLHYALIHSHRTYCIGMGSAIKMCIDQLETLQQHLQHINYQFATLLNGCLRITDQQSLWFLRCIHICIVWLCVLFYSQN